MLSFSAALHVNQNAGNLANLKVAFFGKLDAVNVEHHMHLEACDSILTSFGEEPLEIGGKRFRVTLWFRDNEPSVSIKLYDNEYGTFFRVQTGEEFHKTSTVRLVKIDQQPSELFGMLEGVNFEVPLNEVGLGGFYVVLEYSCEGKVRNVVRWNPSRGPVYDFVMRLESLCGAGIHPDYK